jgi:hypothetical protein
MKIYEVIAEDAAYNVGFAAGKTAKLINQWIITHKLHGTVLTNWVAKSAGTYLRVIKYLGFYDIAVQLIQQRTAINGLVASKQITAEEGEAAKRQLYEKMVAAILVTTSFAKLIGLLKYLPFVKWFVRAGGVVATGATLGIAGGPSIMIALATEVGVIWLTQYLSTKEGQEALAWWVVYIIDPSVTWAWDNSIGRISDSWKSSKISKDAQAKVDGTIKGKDDSTGSGIAGKPSADAKKDIAASSSDMFTPVPAYDPHSGKDLGWASTNKYMTKGGGTASPVAPPR